MAESLTFYTAAEVADLLRLNHQVVQRKLQGGDIPAYKIGREWRVERAQLLGWLEQHSNTRSKSDKDLAPFFDATGRLKALPAQRRKRDLVLARLASEFQPERAYPEREVNATLRRFHDDVATIRRELIATKLLVRTRAGVYKRAAPREPALRRG